MAIVRYGTENNGPFEVEVADALAEQFAVDHGGYVVGGENDPGDVYRDENGKPVERPEEEPEDTRIEDERVVQNVPRPDERVDDYSVTDRDHTVTGDRDVPVSESGNPLPQPGQDSPTVANDTRANDTGVAQAGPVGPVE